MVVLRLSGLMTLVRARGAVYDTPIVTATDNSKHLALTITTLPYRLLSFTSSSSSQDIFIFTWQRCSRRHLSRTSAYDKKKTDVQHRTQSNSPHRHGTQGRILHLPRVLQGSLPESSKSGAMDPLPLLPLPPRYHRAGSPDNSTRHRVVSLCARRFLASSFHP